ncbi:MAG TPA: site-specific integrase [Tepidisphaeraceae bacterium]
MREFRDNLLKATYIMPGSTRMQPKPYSRRTINNDLARVIEIFRWGREMQLIPEDAFRAIEDVRRVRHGQYGVKDRPTEKDSLPTADIEAIKPYVSQIVRDMITLQECTGARPGEICAMRPVDIEVNGPVWVYRPPDHKTAHRGDQRNIYLGPQAIEIVQRYLADSNGQLEAPMFSAAKSAAWHRAQKHALRKSPMNQGNKPSVRTVKQPKRVPRDHFTTNSYRQAIERGCILADVPVWKPHGLSTRSG